MATSPMKQPSALAPLVMSFAALALVVGHAVIFGVVHQADEGTAAHIFQLIMIGQVPIVAFFGAKWFPRAPRQTLQVLAPQAGAVLAAVVAVLLLT